ncbi:MAG: hypothetical protein WBA10_00090 [Elainellaceae cyanobacterium]
MDNQPRTDPKPADAALKASDVGPGAFATFLYYFTSTTILSALVVVRGLDLSVTTGVPQRLGLMVGLLAGALGVYFNRTVTLEVAASNSDRTLAEIEAALSELGYSLDEAALAAADDTDLPFRVYQRSALGKLLSGRVYVQQAKNQLIVASRAVHLRQLRRQLER